MNEDVKDLRKYAWDYFHFHATQRLTTFNFYIVIITVISAALIKSISIGLEHKILGLYLGALVAAISFIFWKLDQRNSNLVKNGEKALRALDIKNTGEDASLQTLRIFEADDKKTDPMRKNNSRNFLKRYYSYSDCFFHIFMFFVIFGVIVFVYCFYSLITFQ